MTLALSDSPGHETAGDPGPDRRGRALRDLRISVTDRCNCRCTYCMPRDEFGSASPAANRSPVAICELIARLAAIRTGHNAPGVDLALTTNGSLLPRLAPALAEAGLHRVTVSLDTLDDPVFRAMTDSRFGVRDVRAGIDAAAKAGLGPVKINTVVLRGVNDGNGLRGVLDLAEHFRGPCPALRRRAALHLLVHHNRYRPARRAARRRHRHRPRRPHFRPLASP